MKLIAVLAIALLITVTAVAADDAVRQLLVDLEITAAKAVTPPAFTLPDLDGKPVSLASLKDRAALLYFWATW